MLRIAARQAARSRAPIVPDNLYVKELNLVMSHIGDPVIQ